MLKVLLTILIYCIFSTGYAQNLSQPLPVDKAFAVTAFMDQNKQLVLQWNIAPSYYLYRDQLIISPASQSQARLGPIDLPAGQTKKDEFHGVFQSYSGLLTVHVPTAGKTDGMLDVNFNYQGCSSQGFCYPPVKQSIHVNLATIMGPTDLTDNIVALLPHASDTAASRSDYVTRLFAGQHLFIILLGFLGLGLLLAFTPCVLPMVPILSSIIVGYGKDISTRKAFSLSLAYVLGMALSYANAGMIVAFAGGSIQAALQKPWVIGLFSGFFVLLALSLFGSYNLRLPSKWHQRIVSWSHRHQGGTYVGVFFMGGFSTLVVSPCVSAPLVGVLTYIANSGDVILGGSALLALGIGMGIPLLLVGTAAGRFLPKAGIWMEKIKHLFGFFMLGFAIWMLSRIISATLTLYLWAMLIIFIAVTIWSMKPSERKWLQLHKGIGLGFLSYGLVLIASAYFGFTDPFNPFGKFSHTLVAEKSAFVIVKDMTDLDQQLQLAKDNKKQVLLDFYADWCASCLVMDHHVFNRPAIQNELNQFVLLRADVTKNNTFDRAILKRYNVVAPPTVVFFDMQGNRLSEEQIVGEVNEKELLADIGRVNNQRMNYCQSKIHAC